MKVLVLGSGAREHALAVSLARSPVVHKLYVCPGNAGMLSIPICARLPFHGNSELIAFAKREINLAVIGSSRFVTQGTVDALLTAGIPVIGPAADAGRIETSKAFAATFVARHGIPAPITEVVRNRREAEAFLRENPWVRVVKTDGFSQGMGVSLVDDAEEALLAVERFLKKHGPPVILQERLAGQECLYSILTDGNQWVSFSSCLEYKRAHDGGLGPTTGGMGSVSPCPGLTGDIEEDIRNRIVTPVVEGLRADRLLYRGFLSLHLMLTPHGPRVLELNARLGDPEMQTILARFRGNLAGLLHDCALGRLDAMGSEVAFGKQSAVSVVVVREGYPQDESGDSVIFGLDEIAPSALSFAACEKHEDEKIRWKFMRGRLVTVTALGESLETARTSCYQEVAKLSLRQARFRADIGLPPGRTANSLP